METIMRRLVLLLAVGAFLSIAGIASADTTPATTTTTTTTTPAPSTSDRHANGHWFAGSVSSVGSSSLTLGVLWTGPNDGSLNGQTVTVAVATSTRINQGPHHRPIALADIQPGDLVAVRAVGDVPSSLTAARIHVFCNCHWVGGTIASVGTSSFTVNVKHTGPYDTVLDNTTVTFQVNASTVYLRGRHGARIALADLKAGAGVGVVFSADGFFKAPGFDPTKATFTAKRVHVWGLRQVPQASSDAAASAQVTT
jgi:hypothetical protein